jgi:hypothetical protein
LFWLEVGWMMVVAGQGAGGKRSAPHRLIEVSGHFFRSRFDSQFDPFALERSGHKNNTNGGVTATVTKYVQTQIEALSSKLSISYVSSSRELFL